MRVNKSLTTNEKPQPLITSKQEKAIIALLSQPTTKDAATSAGVSEATLWRWLQDPDFRASYMQARRLAVQRAIARIQAVTTEAVETLREVMNDRSAKGSERVSAAKAVIELAYKGIDLEDFATRLAAIEGTLKDRAR